MKHQVFGFLSAIGLGCGLVVGCGASDQKSDDGLLAGSGGQASIVTPPPAAIGSGGMVAPPPVIQAMAGSAAPPPVAMGTGGMKAPPPVAMGTGGTTAKDPTMAPGEPVLGECTDLHTKFAGDEYCIKPPPADKGFQLHIGPSNYDNPELQYILGAGVETTDTFTAVSGNDKDVYFYYRQIRQRTGAHHNIITSGGGGDIGLGQRIATSNNLAADDPPGGIVAPENVGVGIQMPAHTTISVNLHSINTTEQDELREVWVNFWYVDPAKVKEPVKEMFNIAPMGSILPGADVTFGSSCNVAGTGRLLWAYGHRHANNVRFSIWRQRASKKDLIYQGYNYEDPLVLDYSSTVKNAVPDTGPMVEGGWSGILDLMPGDQLLWECHVINNQSVPLNFTNNTYTGEMCILDAETVGATCM